MEFLVTLPALFEGCAITCVKENDCVKRGIDNKRKRSSGSSGSSVSKKLLLYRFAEYLRDIFIVN